MDSKQFEAIMKKLNILVRLLSLDVAQGREFREQVRILSAAGLTPKEIADSLGKTLNNVNQALYHIRHKKGMKAK